MTRVEVQTLRGFACVLPALLLLLSGCSGSEDAEQEDSSRDVAGETIAGAWRPVYVAERTQPLPNDAHIDFNEDGEWSGSDGCNAISGTLTLSGNEVQGVEPAGNTDIGCHNLPFTLKVMATETIDQEGDTLEFRDAEATLLMLFVRDGPSS